MPLIVKQIALTKMKAELRELIKDIHECEDSDTLIGLKVYNEALIDECEKYLPSWYWGNEDRKGVKRAFDDKERKLNAINSF